MKIKLPTFECLRCGHRWHPKQEEKPRCCGFCKSPYWDTAPSNGEKSDAQVRHSSDCVSGSCNGD